MSKTVRIRRHFPATPERLFAYFANADLAVKWLAPAEMTVIVRELKFISGGIYNFDLRGREGFWKWKGHFREIIPGAMIAMDDEGLRDPDGTVVMTNLEMKWEFTVLSGETEVTLIQSGFFSDEAASAMEISWHQRLSSLMGCIDDENSGNVVESEPTYSV